MVGIGQRSAFRPCGHDIAEGVLDDNSVSAFAFGLEESGVGAVDQGGKVLLIKGLDDSEAHRELR